MGEIGGGRDTYTTPDRIREITELSKRVDALEQFVKGVGKAIKPHPRTCQECTFCGDSSCLAGSHKGGCYHKPGPARDVELDRPACHLGELRDEPWEKGDGE